MDAVDLPHADLGPRSGAAVILLHGFPLDHSMWMPVARSLAAQGHRVLVPDLRGMGKAMVTRGPGSMRAYAADVVRLADRVGVRSFALAGFSMGGYVAFEVARQAPERVTRLTLVDSKAEPDSDEAKKGRAALIEKVRREGQQALVDAMLAKMFTKSAPATLVEETRAVFLRTPVEGAVFALEAMASRPDSRPTVASFKGPLLAVVGEEDPITPPENARAMSKDAVVVKGAAHLAPLERADDVARAILAWLR